METFKRFFEHKYMLTKKAQVDNLSSCGRFLLYKAMVRHAVEENFKIPKIWQIEKEKQNYSNCCKLWEHTGMFFSTVCYRLSLSPLLFVCTQCSRGQEGEWAYWNSVYPRGRHSRVLLPAQLLLQEDDRERALHHRGEQLSRRQTLHTLPCRLPAALRGHHRVQVREQYSLFWKIKLLMETIFSKFESNNFQRNISSADITTGIPLTTLQHPSTATCSNRSKKWN